MRGGRSFLILLVLALGLGGYAYFVESKRDLSDPKTVKAKVFGLEAGKIEEVKVTSASGETTKHTDVESMARGAAQPVLLAPRWTGQQRWVLASRRHRP